MRLPSKITSYNESILSKIPIILSELQINEASILFLYDKTKRSFANIEEFIDTLDCLFALNKIQYDTAREVLRYVN